MNKKRSALLLAASVMVSLFATAPLVAQDFKPQSPPLPISAMAKDYDLAGATLSPDGKHIAALAYLPGQPNPVVRVWETADLSKAPKQFGSKTMRFVSLNFIKNDKIMLNIAQPVKSGAKSDWVFDVAISNLDGSKIIQVYKDNVANTRDEDRVLGYGLYSRLPLDEDSILIEISKFAGTEIERVNLKSGTRRREVRSGDDESFDWSDSDGIVRVKSELYSAGGKYYQRYHYRDVGGSWKEMPGLLNSLNDRYSLDVIHVSKDNKTIWVLTNKDTEYMVLKKFDIATQTFSAPIAQNTEYDLTSVSFGSADDEYAVDQDPIRTICWGGPASECQRNDPTDARIEEKLYKTFPNAIVKFTVKEKGKLVLVSVQGPNQPVTYFLLKDEKQLIRLGSNLEGWDRSKLGPAEWVVYPARDGMKIPGILFLPPGYDKAKHGKLPTVILPHGGPWSRDDIEFDGSYWPQMFATRGFAVLQPNYRGSQGLGKTLWKSGDKNWGLKMQDDKDDGAKWLIEQGIADPNRMMMYGYSYGGFAAMSAATRSSDLSAGLYQCAIAGGPAIDLVRISNDWGANRLQRKLQGETVAGLNPFENLHKIKIPTLIVHGAYDHQADILHSTDTVSKMKSVNPNATFKYVEIDKMSHTLTEMLPEHKEHLMAEILNWTANNCGNISKTFDDEEAEKLVKKYSKGK